MTEYIKCKTCLYNKNCQFLATHKNTVVEGCTAYKNAADMVEIKHGYWITDNDPIFGKTCVCSICGSCPTMEYKYCPYCGAKMDSEAGDEK